jgi:formate hydrogenlyase subunit 3/multisubunit Na+/H+ antiporter MnhD subunit
MISSVFAVIMFLGMILPWLLNRSRPKTVYLLGALPALLALYFIYLAGRDLPLSELIGSKDPALGISVALGFRELIWLLSTLFLISVHFVIHRKTFLGLSVTSLVLYLFSLLAVCGILLTRDVFNLFVMLELFSVSMIGLILADTKHTNALKAFAFMLINSVAAAMFLIGITLIYRQTGLLNLDALLDLAVSGSLPGSATAFIMAALSLKLMLFPLHSWANILIGRSGGIAASYISMLMPMVFVYDLQKLSGLIGPAQISFVAFLAAITLLYSGYRLLRYRTKQRADIVFAINAIFVLAFTFHYFRDAYALLLTVGLVSSMLKILVLSRGKAKDDPELSSVGYFPNLNNSILAILIVLFVYFVVSA